MELAANTSSAKSLYSAIIASVPRTGYAFEAALRLRELERLEKQRTTREELRRLAEQERESPRYQHGVRAVNRSAPTYPPALRGAGIEGWVVVDFGISKKGAIVDPVVLSSTPPFLFEGSALAAVRSWVYAASEKSEPIRATVRLAFVLDHLSPVAVRVATRADTSGLDPLEQRGRELFENHLAAARAGSALVQAGHVGSSWDWIVVPDENGSLVRFLDNQEMVFADVLVDVFSSDAEQVTFHDAPVALPAEQWEMWSGRKAALELLRELAIEGCGAAFRTVVLPSLDPSRSWDVYLLGASTNPRVVPIGGHYRIAVSRDSNVPPEMHAFTKTCDDQTASSETEMLRITDTTSKTPTEVHIFLNLRYGNPLGIVMAEGNGALWFVKDGRMSIDGGSSAE